MRVRNELKHLNFLQFTYRIPFDVGILALDAVLRPAAAINNMGAYDRNPADEHGYDVDPPEPAGFEEHNSAYLLYQIEYFKAVILKIS